MCVCVYESSMYSTAYVGSNQLGAAHKSQMLSIDNIQEACFATAELTF